MVHNQIYKEQRLKHRQKQGERITSEKELDQTSCTQCTLWALIYVWQGLQPTYLHHYGMVGQTFDKKKNTME